MVEGTNERIDTAEIGGKQFKLKSDSHLGRILAGRIESDEGGDEPFEGSVGSIDARTEDPVEISKKRGPKPLTEAEREARRKARAQEKARVSVKEPEPLPSDAVAQLSLYLSLGHMALAKYFAAPELVLSEEENEAYTKALANFLKWNMAIKIEDGKMGSRIGLAVTVAMIYIPKVMTILDRKKSENVKSAQPIQGARVI